MRDRLSNTSFFTFAVFSVLTGSACDIVQGFRDASSAVFPPERTYFDAPGFRLLTGGYRSLDFAAGSDLYVLVRSSDPADASLYAMRYADPKPCAIPNVGPDYRGAQSKYRGPAVIAYFEPGEEESVLRFSDGECHHYDLAIPGARLPIQELPQGFIVLANGILSLVDPVAGTIQQLVTSVEHVSLSAFAELHVLRVANRIAVFRQDWKEIQRFGNGLHATGVLGSSYYFEDSAGIHRLKSSGGDDPTVTDELIGPDACQFAFAPGLGGAEAWVTFRSPCNDEAITVYGDGSGRATKLRLPPEADRVGLVPAGTSMAGDPAKDPFLYFYLVGLDENALGTLVMRTPDGVDHTLGSRASFSNLTVIPSPSGTNGYALVDVDPDLDAGRYIRWQIDGSTQTLAEPVRHGGGDIIVNPNGRTGDFALPSTDGLQIVARQVPFWYFRFREQNNRWSALFSDYDGTVATLSVTPSGLDFGPAARTLSPKPVPEVIPIARGVRADWRAQFVQSLPGIVYLTNFDVEHDTGRLEYRNLELGFTATVSEGVSDFVGSTDSLIYAVPFGVSAGIWAVRAR